LISGHVPPAAIPRVGATPPLAAVLFDAGLTLIRSATPTAVVAAEVLAAAGLEVHATDLERAMAAAESDLEARWHGGDWWASERSVRALFVHAYEAGLAGLPDVRLTPDRGARLAAAMYEAYLDTRHWALFPDVLPALNALRAAGIQMGVVSDWGHGLEAILLELELGSYFEFLVVSSRLGVSKPSPHVFDMALGRIGVGPRQAIYVGDTYVKDVLGARSAGLTPVLLDRRGVAPPLDCIVIGSLAALLPLVGLGTSPDGGS